MGSIGCALTNSRYKRSSDNFLITRWYARTDQVHIQAPIIAGGYPSR